MICSDVRSNENVCPGSIRVSFMHIPSQPQQLQTHPLLEKIHNHVVPNERRTNLRRDRDREREGKRERGRQRDRGREKGGRGSSGCTCSFTHARLSV